MMVLLAIALSFVNSGTVVAQNAPTGCPSIMAAGSVSGLDTIVPHGSCITLRAEVVATATTANDYTVSSIPFNPPFSFQSGTQINLTSDDYYAAIINLPFDFCFYGNTYTQACVGANGVVSFNASNNGGFCAYNYASWVPIPNANFPASLVNAIYGVCEDVWPGYSTGVGRIFQGVMGTYPCRVACISYDQCPLFGNYSVKNSYQIVIYEGTNIIDVYIKNRSCCSTTNSGNGLVGVQNSTGTRAVTAPNRNGGRWTATNEAWRFTPTGTPHYTVSWYYGTDTSAATGTLLKIDTINSDTAMSRLRVCPITADTFTARLQYVACNGDSFDMISSTVITNAELKYYDTVVCVSDCYTAHGITHCAPGVYIDTIRNFYGYDSVISRVVIADTLRDTLHPVICAGQTFDTNGQSYSRTGFYNFMLHDTVTTCYTRVYIDLTVSDTIRDTVRPIICAGASYDTNGQSYTHTGFYSQLLRDSVSWCFNRLYIDLTVSDTLRDTVHPIICAGASYDTNGQSFTHTGFYSQLLRDSVTLCYNRLYIDLTVSDTIRDTVHPIICAGASYDTNGQSYTIQGFYSQLLRDSVSWCFNRLYIDLTVSDTIRDTVHPIICAGASYDTNGESYTVAGFYSQLLRDSVTRCYNRLYIDLTVSDTLRDTVHPIICAGASYDTNGQSYTIQGFYSQLLRDSVSHCFNRLYIDLTVSDTLRDTVYRTICAGASYDTNGQSYTIAGFYSQLLRDSVSRCYNRLYIDLTVSDTIRDTVHRAICAGASYDTNGQSYTHTGFYSQLLRDSVTRCFNRLYIDLTVSDTIRDTVHRTICAGASYDTNGHSYTLTGFYSQLLRDSVNRCYNRLYIDLTVSDTLRDTVHPIICAGASYDTNGQSFTIQGFYSQLLRDSVSWCYNRLYIDLTVSDTIRDTVRPIICAGASYDTNGQSYTLTGFYSQLLRDSVNRCYNRLYIDLTVSDTLRDTVRPIICAGASYDTNGESYTVAGFYSQLLRDSVTRCYNRLYIDLTVSDTLRDTVRRTICAGASYDTNGQSYTIQGF